MGAAGRRGRGAQGAGPVQGAGPPGRCSRCPPTAWRPAATPELPRLCASFLAAPHSQPPLAHRGTPREFGARVWGGAEGGAPAWGLSSRRCRGPGVPRHEEPSGARAHGPRGSPPSTRALSRRGGAPPPAREPAPHSRGPRPGSALAAAPALPGPGLSGSPRVACFSNFSLFPSSRTSGALPLGPAPVVGGPGGGGVSTPRPPSFGRTRDGREGTQERPGPGRGGGSSPPPAPLPRRGSLPPPGSARPGTSLRLTWDAALLGMGTRPWFPITHAPLSPGAPRSPSAVPEGLDQH